MSKQQTAWPRRFALGAMLLSTPLMAWSDGTFPARSSENQKTCYCGCDMKAGTPMCMQMCELPKYANRSWAVSCEKKKTALNPAAAPQSGSHHSKKTNRVQSARR